MTSLKARPVRVTFGSSSFAVELEDGRVLSVPLHWFPRLQQASVQQRENVRLSPRGLHWESIDEDISVAGLLAGRRDRTRHAVAA